VGQELYELPEGWELHELGELCQVDIGRTPPRSKPYLFKGDIPWATIADLSDEYIIDTKEKVTAEAVEKHKHKLVINGTLLMSFKLTLGKLAFAGCDLFTNEAIAALSIKDSQDLYNRYLFYALQSIDLEGEVDNAVKGKTLNKKKLAVLKIPLPPLNEQKRIVTKLDALFTHIDTAITHLQQTLELSKSLLASALDSALVPTGNIESPPESWSCEALHAVSSLVSDGTHHSPKEQFHDKQDGLYKYVTSKNIKFDGLKLDNVTYIKKKVHDEIYARCNPEYLDQLITKDGAMTGTCCLNTLDEPFSLLSSVALVKLKQELMLPHFLNYFLQSPTGQELMIGDISGAAITRTNLKKLKAIKVPLPPIKEQQRIVSHLNSLSERTRTLKASTQEKINDLSALKASLLNAAFKGEL